MIALGVILVLIEITLVMVLLGIVTMAKEIAALRVNQLKSIDVVLKQIALNTAPMVPKPTPPRPSDKKKSFDTQVDKQDEEWLP